MLVWEIQLGTERAQKGARPPRSAPTSKYRLAEALLGKWGEFSLWSLSKRGERMEYQGTRDWERSQTAAGGGGSRGCSGGRLGAQGRRCPGSRSLNTRTRPKGRTPSRSERAGRSAPARGAQKRGKRAATSLGSDRPTHALSMSEEGARLTNSRVRECRAGKKAGPRPSGPPRSQ